LAGWGFVQLGILKLQSVTVVKAKASGIMLKESIVFLKSDISELILNTVCEGNVTKTVKSRVNLITMKIVFYN